MKLLLKSRSIFLCIILAAFAVLLSFSALPGADVHARGSGQVTPIVQLVAIGGGYVDTYPNFVRTAAENAHQGYVRILVLPMALSSNAESISDDELLTNLAAANERRAQIEQACNQVIFISMQCIVDVSPLFVRDDALDPEMLEYFQTELSAIYILNGDPSVAINVINGTPVEVALTQAYENGVIIAGTAAGGSLQSAALLAGYNPDFDASSAFRFGAVDLWNGAEKHGLPFGVRQAVLETRFFQQGRLGRLLNAISQPAPPHVGVGIDAFTGVKILEGSQIQEIFGLYGAAVLDAETYGSARGAHYVGCPDNSLASLDCTPLLSLRNVLVHLLAPGGYGYDLQTRRYSLADPPSRMARNFDQLRLPPGAGTLILADGLNESATSQTLLSRLVDLSGGSQARILILAAGFPTQEAASYRTATLAASLGVPSDILIVSETLDAPPELPSRFTGILFTASDQSLINPTNLPDLKKSWMDGTPILAEDAAAAVLGEMYAAHKAMPANTEEQELFSQKSMLLGTTSINNGLSFLPITVEPQILRANRWGFLFSLAFNHPSLLHFGLTGNSALEITSIGAQTLGDNVILSLDFRHASLNLGSNQGFVAANGLIDVFAPGEAVQPKMADVDALPAPQDTPIYITPTATPIPSLTPTPTLTASPTTTPPPPTKPPTRTPRPTITQPAIPPPSDPRTTQWVIVFGVLVVVVIIIGILISRPRNWN